MLVVDFFRHNPDVQPPLACFLSHVHSDHLAGLESLRSPLLVSSCEDQRQATDTYQRVLLGCYPGDPPSPRALSLSDQLCQGPLGGQATDLQASKQGPSMYPWLDP